jgi:hypothetical protein
LIILNPLWLPTPETDGEIMGRLKGLPNSKLHTRVSGIVITNKRAEPARGIKIKTRPFVVINTHAKQRCDHDLERLAQALIKCPNWM